MDERGERRLVPVFDLPTEGLAGPGSGGANGAAGDGTAAGSRGEGIRPMPLLGAGGPRVSRVRNIAVLRGGGLGDLIFALPALEALRAAYPDARIVLLGAPWAAAFLGERPSPVDRVAPLPVAAGVYEPPFAVEDAEDAEAFFASMRGERFDLAIQIHGGGAHSNPFVDRIGARVTAGLRAAGAPPLDRNVPYVYYQSEVLRALEVVSLVGAPPVRLEPRLEATETDLAEAAAILPATRLPLAVLHPGAGDARRRWPIEKFAAVGDALAAAGAQVVVTGLADEADTTRALVDAMDAGATDAAPIDLGGRVTLGGLVGVLARAAVVVSNDSGPLHVAAAAGAATVGIYWCGNLINAGPFSRGRHRPVVSWRLDCPECGADCTREGCEHAASFVADAPLEEARDAALELLEAAVPRERSSRRGAVEGVAG